MEEAVEKKNKYNDIPVLYCTDCLSLRVLGVGEVNYCEKCGSTNVESTDIFSWEKMYAARYAGSYLNMKEKNNGKSRI